MRRLPRRDWRSLRASIELNSPNDARRASPETLEFTSHPPITPCNIPDIVSQIAFSMSRAIRFPLSRHDLRRHFPERQMQNSLNPEKHNHFAPAAQNSRAKMNLGGRRGFLGCRTAPHDRQR
jgi:hypothetical protein